jgi:centromeric protein E
MNSLKCVFPLYLPVIASVFAYGQTSSGKTYTMTGITEHTAADIYDYIAKVTEEFFLVL